MREHDPLFKGATRPPMIWGVTYTYFVLNVFLNVEAFIVTSGFTYLIVTLPAVHVFGVIACARDPFIFELWRLRLMKTPPVPNYRYWRCNSYSP